ncbi:hypothetical protein B0H63DRAFT_290 [Podospora didyma]|uniref:Uncharacterized protein n=1 Tax=Podospora didyma TaxID=330526 RepID=A0AAE0U6G2_9PEZI|nr:hypothetical protein B0H63DRAFT_290 [Podospora didyma]
MHLTRAALAIALAATTTSALPKCGDVYGSIDEKRSLCGSGFTVRPDQKRSYAPGAASIKNDEPANGGLATPPNSPSHSADEKRDEVRHQPPYEAPVAHFKSGSSGETVEMQPIDSKIGMSSGSSGWKSRSGKRSHHLNVQGWSNGGQGVTEDGLHRIGARGDDDEDDDDEGDTIIMNEEQQHHTGARLYQAAGNRVQARGHYLTEIEDAQRTAGAVAPGKVQAFDKPITLVFPAEDFQRVGGVAPTKAIQARGEGQPAVTIVIPDDDAQRTAGARVYFPNPNNGVPAFLGPKSSPFKAIRDFVKSTLGGQLEGEQSLHAMSMNHGGMSSSSSSSSPDKKYYQGSSKRSTEYAQPYAGLVPPAKKFDTSLPPLFGVDKVKSESNEEEERFSNSGISQPPAQQPVQVRSTSERYTGSGGVETSMEEEMGNLKINARQDVQPASANGMRFSGKPYSCSGQGCLPLSSEEDSHDNQNQPSQHVFRRTEGGVEVQDEENKENPARLKMAKGSNSGVSASGGAINYRSTEGSVEVQDEEIKENPARLKMVKGSNSGVSANGGAINYRSTEGSVEVQDEEIKENPARLKMVKGSNSGVSANGGAINYRSTEGGVEVQDEENKENPARLKMAKGSNSGVSASGGAINYRSTEGGVEVQDEEIKENPARLKMVKGSNSGVSANGGAINYRSTEGGFEVQDEENKENPARLKMVKGSNSGVSANGGAINYRSTEGGFEVQDEENKENPARLKMVTGIISGSNSAGISGSRTLLYRSTEGGVEVQDDENKENSAVLKMTKGGSKLGVVGSAPEVAGAGSGSGGSGGSGSTTSAEKYAIPAADVPQHVEPYNDFSSVGQSSSSWSGGVLQKNNDDSQGTIANSATGTDVHDWAYTKMAMSNSQSTMNGASSGNSNTAEERRRSLQQPPSQEGSMFHQLDGQSDGTVKCSNSNGFGCDGSTGARGRFDSFKPKGARSEPFTPPTGSYSSAGKVDQVLE